MPTTPTTLEPGQTVWEAVLERGCGLDVHQKTVTACLLIGPLEEQPTEGEVTVDRTNVILAIMLYDVASDTIPGYVSTLLSPPAGGFDGMPVFGGVLAICHPGDNGPGSDRLFQGMKWTDWLLPALT